MEKFGNVANNIANINRFKHLTKDKLIKKTEEYKKNKFKRYIYNHKGRIAVIFLTILILIICFYFAIPTNGDQDTTNKYTHLLSILGFFASNIFLCLLITVIGVETYFSRDEYEQLESALNDKIDNGFKILENIENMDIINKINKTINKIKNYKLKKNKIIHGENDSTRSVNFDRSTYVENLQRINDNINELNLDKKAILLHELSKIINELNNK